MLCTIFICLIFLTHFPHSPSLSLPLPTNARPYSVHIGSDGQVQPVNFPVDAISAPDLPRSIRTYCTLSHNEVVCAVAISDPVKHIYTGGKVVSSLQLVLQVWPLCLSCYRAVWRCGTCRWYRVAIELLKHQSTLSIVLETTTSDHASSFQMEGHSLLEERLTHSTCGTWLL